MYLATTTGDFGGYTPLQTQSMEYIRQSGFSYLDYNFGSDYARRDGVYSENWKDYLQTIREKAEELGRPPRKADFDDATRARIKTFLGPWPRALEQAGLKPTPLNDGKNKATEKT